MIRVLLVDDQAMVRKGFGMILSVEEDIHVVGEAADGIEAVRETRRLEPDVVLMDVQMPELDGLEATRQLLEVVPDTRVLMLTTFERDEYIFEALRIGASGFMLKNAPPEDLVDAIRVVAAGDALLAPSVTERVIQEFAKKVTPARLPSAELANLTEREHEVLRLVARGLTNAEVATQLIIGEATVKTHVSNLLAKLGLRDRVQAVVFAYENGIVAAGVDVQPSSGTAS